MSTIIDNDVLLNITRRKEKIIFRSILDEESVSLDYLSNPSINSKNTLNIFDTSAALSANKVQTNDEYIIIKNISEYSIYTNKFLITDIFITDFTTTNKVALFYKHILDNNRLPKTTVDDELVIDSSYKLLEVNILNKNFVPIKVEAIQIDYEAGIIYNNLNSTFTEDNQLENIYYIYYTVQGPSSTYSYIELLNNQAVYTEADYEDYDNNMQLITTHKVYSVEEQNSAFLVKFPSIGDYAFKLFDESLIGVSQPLTLNNTQSWYLSIKSNSFYTSINGIDYKYYLPEYIQQPWNPSFPYKYSDSEISTYLSVNLFSTQHPHISIEDDVYCDVLIYDEDETALAAFTTDSSLHGTTASNGATYSYWSTDNQMGIRSIDYDNGIIDIDGFSLKDTYIIRSSYYYEDKEYSFKAIDFNPLNNPNLIPQKVILFIDPEEVGETKIQTLYYLILDQSGRVVQSNWSLFDNEDQVYLGEAIDNPLTITNNEESVEVETLGYAPLYYKSVPDWAKVEVGGDLIAWQELFITHTVNYTTITEPLFVIGEINIVDNSSPNQSDILDTRIRGGGIQEDEIENLKVINPEAGNYLDIGCLNGISYPGYSSVYIEIPASLLKGAGGIFDGAQIRKIVKQHMGFGKYPIIKTYGVEKDITSINLTSSSITLSWDFYGTKI